MKILVGHNFYQQPGGEDAVFRSHVQILRSFGHDVRVYERRNDEIGSGLLSRARHMMSLRWSQASYNEMRRLLKEFQPDVAHVHNVYFVMTPSVFYACRDENIPVIVSLHNFRLMCINGLLFRDNHPCEDCLTRTRTEGVAHKCYRGSWMLSKAMTDMMDHHWKRRTWTDVVDRFIVATEFSKAKHIQAGIPSEKIRVIGHCVEDSGMPLKDRGDYALYAGRLSDEKGINVLLKAWTKIKDSPLYIAGSGPRRADVEQFVQAEGLTNVKVLGFLDNQDYQQMFRRAKVIVVPSTCYENFPRVVVEAYAAGVPVLVSRVGSLPEIVIDGETGVLFAGNDAEDLATKAQALMKDDARCEVFGVNARKRYENCFTPHHHHQALMDCYASARS